MIERAFSQVIKDTGRTMSKPRSSGRTAVIDFGLPVDSHPLLLGHVGRLVEQKGADLILDILDELMQHPVQLIILGSGEKPLEQKLLNAARHYPDQLAVHVGYDEQIAHRIEAGADCFLMPSRYEPCGLNQMYSLRYGSPPVVRDTGGLADTVVDATPRSLAREEANGFVFDEPTADALQGALQRAFELHRKPKQWMKLMKIGMRGDYGWHLSAEHYLNLYSEK